MLKRIAEAVKAVCVVIFGANATVWIGASLTWWCMKMYDIFWNPSNICVGIPSINIQGWASIAIMLMMVFCVYVMDQIIKEETEELEES